jgi:hypothetical protein
MSEKKSYFKFNHPNDITIGWGRIIYERAYGVWVLPGGEHTDDRARAEAVAQAIDEMTTKQDGPSPVTEEAAQ